MPFFIKIQKIFLFTFVRRLKVAELYSERGKKNFEINVVDTVHIHLQLLQLLDRIKNTTDWLIARYCHINEINYV
jgi:hypothetical protein